MLVPIISLRNKIMNIGIYVENLNVANNVENDRTVTVILNMCNISRLYVLLAGKVR